MIFFLKFFLDKVIICLWDSLMFILTKNSYMINKSVRRVKRQVGQLLEWLLLECSELATNRLGCLSLVVDFMKFGGSGREWDQWFELEGSLKWPATEIREWHGNWLSCSHILRRNERGENGICCTRGEMGVPKGNLITQMPSRWLMPCIHLEIGLVSSPSGWLLSRERKG